MKKEIKDYLHFYLGCQCLCFDERNPGEQDIGVLIEVGKSHAVINPEKGKNDIEGILSEFKPILRRMKDITGDEVLELHHLSVEDNSKDGMSLKSYYSSEPLFLEPVQFYFLLSKHFDLFGLIDAGLAIDKATVK